jgi:phage baseplate assembly protein W
VNQKTTNQRIRQKEKAFLGIGWGFPLGFQSDGAIEVAIFEEDVQQAIHIILGTDRGERLMRPDFGAGLQDFVFSPVTFTTTEQVRVRVQEALVDWEPRIEIVEVKVEASAPLRSRLDITIRYRVRATNTLHNLVYPFYLQEGARA